ncbi:MAG: nucleoid-associated protein [Anaeroplasmataceae bacterium]
MIINKAILNVIDKENDMIFNSLNELELEINLTTLLDKMLEHIFNDTNKNNAIFNDDSKVLNLFESFNANQLSFIEISKDLSVEYFNHLKEAEDYNKTDIISVLFNHEGNRYFGMLFLENKNQFIHNVNMTENGINNTLVLNSSVLPTTASVYMIVNLDTYSLLLKDKKRVIDGKNQMILSTILSSNAEISLKKSLNIIKKTAINLCDNASLGPNLVAKAKAYIYENSKENLTLDTKAMIEEVFNENDVIKEEFQNTIKKYNIPEVIDIPREIAFKEALNHKITTDTGIEITFPSEYYENDNYITFINNPDGTISIEIKNVGKITNK